MWWKLYDPNLPFLHESPVWRTDVRTDGIAIACARLQHMLLRATIHLLIGKAFLRLWTEQMDAAAGHLVVSGGCCYVRWACACVREDWDGKEHCWDDVVAFGHCFKCSAACEKTLQNAEYGMQNSTMYTLWNYRCRMFGYLLAVGNYCKCSHALIQ